MIQSIAAFFAFGALGFWILTIVASIIFIACIENEKIVFPFLLTAGLVAIYFNNLTDLAASVTWRGIVGGAVAYVLIGIVWSFIKWGRHTRNAVKDFKKHRNSATSLKQEVDVTQNKARLTGWIAWWPWSIVWSSTGGFFSLCYDGVAGCYQKISNRALADAGVKPD